MPSLKHVHIYAKYKGRPGFFRCADPLCTHFMDKERVIGKMTKCNLCGAEFILDRESALRSRPRCLNCSTSKKALAHKSATALVNEFLKGEVE